MHEDELIRGAFGYLLEFMQRASNANANGSPMIVIAYFFVSVEFGILKEIRHIQLAATPMHV
jgi:hypothetical protein